MTDTATKDITTYKCRSASEAWLQTAISMNNSEPVIRISLPYRQVSDEFRSTMRELRKDVEALPDSPTETIIRRTR